jgi:AcrR family transcriptional regulator
MTDTDARTSERKPKEVRWQEIVEKATELFYEKGYQGSSLQDLADKIGILKGSIYYYIGSKEDLLDAVIGQVHEAGIRNIDSLAETEGNALERLRRVIVGHVVHMCANLVATTVFLHELDALSEERRNVILGSGHTYQQVFRGLIADGKKEGVIRQDVDERLAALSILGSLNWIHRWYREGAAFTPLDIGTQFADLHVRSVATPEALAALTPEDAATNLAARREP